MQVGSLKEYGARQGMIKSFSRIYHTEGLKGLYGFKEAGWDAAAASIALHHLSANGDVTVSMREKHID